MAKKLLRTEPTILPSKVDEINCSIVSNKFVIGETISYKEICKRLNIEYYSSGNQKKAQIKELEKYMELEKVKSKYLITDIYSEPMMPEIRVAANAIYVKYIECVLLEHLSNNLTGSVYIDTSKLWMLLGMVNPNYTYYRNNPEELEKLGNVSYFNYNNFYFRSGNYLEKIVNSSLNSLQRRFLISYSKPYTITVFLKKNKQGDIIEYNTWEATEEDIKVILHVQREEMLKLGIKDEQEFRFKPLSIKKKFYENIEVRFQEEYGWDCVRKRYHFIYNTDHVTTALEQDRKKLRQMVLESRVEINNKVIDKLNQQIFSLIEKSLKKNEERKQLKRNRSFNYPDGYADTQQMLTEKLMRINK